MNLSNLSMFYEKLDSEFYLTNNDLKNAKYINVDCNFVSSSKYARHRWFNYKEGFSPILVEKIFEEYGLNENSIVCDPFCGAGTTLAVAKAKGMNSFGFEVNPFASFISRVKTNDYNAKDRELLLYYFDELSKKDIDYEIVFPNNDYLCRIFSKEMLIVQLNFKKYIMSLPNGKSKDLMYFAWLCTLEHLSLFRKAGNGLKKKKNPPVCTDARYAALHLLNEKLDVIIADFDELSDGPIPTVVQDSATTINQNILNNSVDLVLFSPPYANCFDYTKIYYLELWFGGFIDSIQSQKNIRMKSVRSHCHAIWPERYIDFYLPELHDELLPLLREQKLWTNRIPNMLKGYFADMEEVLKQVYSILKVGGHCSIVVSNSAYAGIVVPTDVLLAKIAKKIGFTVTEVKVERLIVTSSQQYKKTEGLRKYLRESIVKLEK